MRKYEFTGETKTYKISKYNPKTKVWENYGNGYTQEDVNEITKGYKNNGLFYERKGSKIIYNVEEY